MRPAARMPKLTRRSRILIFIALPAVVLLLIGPRLIDTYVDWLWFGELGYRADPANWGPGSGMPGSGILPVTVPGTVWGWDAVLKRFGTKTFKEVLAPAIDYAENGFPVSERIAFDWNLPNAVAPVASDARRCNGCTVRDPDSVATWYVNGQKPSAGQIVRNPGLARTFRLLQQQGRDVFYRGEIARAIVDKSTSLGGSMTMEDLAAYGKIELRGSG